MTEDIAAIIAAASAIDLERADWITDGEGVGGTLIIDHDSIMLFGRKFDGWADLVDAPGHSAPLEMQFSGHLNEMGARIDSAVISEV